MSRSLVRRSLAAFTLVALAVASIGQAPPVPTPAPTPPAPPAPVPFYFKPPSSVAGDPGTFIQIPVDTNSTKCVRWHVIDKGVNLFPTNLLKDTKTAVVTGQTPGTFRVMTWTADQGESTDGVEVVVTINGAPTPPPSPGPPSPTPGPPAAAYDGLLQAYQQDGSPQAQVAQLAALYRVAGTSTINEQSLKTTSDFATKFKAAVDSLLPSTALPRVRAFLDTVRLQPGPLDAATRSTVGAQYVRIAERLEAIK